MAHLFVQDAAGPWALAPLDGESFSLLPASRQLLTPVAGDTLLKKGVLLQRVAPAARRLWLLLASPDKHVFVNGEPLALGIRQIRDRDEILVYPARQGGKRSKTKTIEPGTRIFFSTEELAHVVPFPGAEHEVFCVRCQQGIEPGQPAVQCPNPECGHWHHAGGELECWTYDATCAMCDQSTAPDADYRWTPEDL